MKLDAIDLRILDAVQRDGRITKLALAEKAGLSPTPCWMRLRKLEKAGVIIGYHA
ncbi:Lrp/AsnC family transcriptional regulator, partial [Pseudomonas sp. BGM005]|nr:Lrp/AsnC family transcriptional regulator [Pseudomonas sp. BG5]